MNKFICAKCKKESDFFGSVMHPCCPDYQFCRECADKLHDIIGKKNIELIKDFVKEEKQ